MHHQLWRRCILGVFGRNNTSEPEINARRRLHHIEYLVTLTYRSNYGEWKDHQLCYLDTVKYDVTPITEEYQNLTQSSLQPSITLEIGVRCACV
jgi:hypothetical protein